MVRLLCVAVLLIFSYSAFGQYVYKTPSGAKYHLATCHTVKNASARITIEEAVQLGLEPCKVCKPPVSTSPQPPDGKIPHGTGETVQCKGLTKAGTRCKHMTRIGNGYCFQHQP